MNFDKTKEFMDFLCKNYVPGNSISVYHKNKEVFSYSSGFADVEEKKPMQATDLLNIYSCSKPVTVISALQLFERGIYLLDDPLYEYIPEFKEMYRKDESGNIIKCEKPITIRNLFNMTAGFNYELNSKAFTEAKKVTNGKMDTVKAIKELAKYPLDFEPGEKWQYSLCHDVLAAFVEVVSGKRFCDYVRDNIFALCGIEDAYYHNEAVLDRMASQYKYIPENEISDSVEAQKSKVDNLGKIVKVDKSVEFVLGENYDSGGAGITTSVKEYAKFANALSNGGIAGTGEKIISRKTIELLRRNTLNEEQLKYLDWEQLRGYGYGLGVRTCLDTSIAGSNGNKYEFGWGGAAGTSILVDLDEELAFVYAHHMLCPREEYYQPRIRNVVYSSLSY